MTIHRLFRIRRSCLMIETWLLTASAFLTPGIQEKFRLSEPFESKGLFCLRESRQKSLFCRNKTAERIYLPALEADVLYFCFRR